MKHSSAVYSGRHDKQINIRFCCFQHCADSDPLQNSTHLSVFTLQLAAEDGLIGAALPCCSWKFHHFRTCLVLLDWLHAHFDNELSVFVADCQPFPVGLLFSCA